MPPVYSSASLLAVDKPYFVDDESKYGHFIDREDWGLTFEAVEAAATSVTLNCTQSGGQHIGELEVDYYYNIYSMADDQAVPLHSIQGSVISENTPPPLAVIKPEDTTRFTIGWTERYGALDSGEYRIRLTVNDIFDESQVHPLMRDFHTSQGYWIEFTIP